MKTHAIVAGRWRPASVSSTLALQAWRHHVVPLWRDQADFVVLDTGFAAGERFLALWQAWRQDPLRCQRLHIVALDSHPLTAVDLLRAHRDSPLAESAQALAQAWPPMTPNLHLLEFEAGHVRLTLGWGDVPSLLRAVRVQAHAVHLATEAAGEAASEAADADVPRWPAPWLKSIARLAAPQATLWAAQTDPALRAGLRTAGFEPLASGDAKADGSSVWTRGAPRFMPRRRPSIQVHSADAIVVGAGLAGAAVAQALAQQGLQVTVLEREAGPAQGASGNPAGLFHGALHPQDGLYARLYRAAALVAANTYRQALQGGAVAGQVQGLLRQQTDAAGLEGMLHTLRAQGLPSDYVQALSAADASAMAGVRLQSPCWFYPSGGWVAPPDWVRAALRSPGIVLRTSAAVQGLKRVGSQWQLLDKEGRVLGQSALLVLCNAEQAAPLLPAGGALAWPLSQARGQVTHWPLNAAPTLRLPVAGEGYALPLPNGLLCGATRQEADIDTALRPADHLHNIERLRRLTGLAPPGDAATWLGRVGWRLHSDDRLPIAGPVPLLAMPAGQRLDQARLLPREPGLFVLTALGARGLSLAPLMGRLVAAQATGTPWPLEQDLVDAVDPGRWTVRAARRQSAIKPT